MVQEEHNYRSQVSKTLDHFMEDLLDGAFGAVLPPQDVLAKQYDVSRTVLREVFSMLLVRNLLDVRSKIGTRVRPVDEWRIVNEDVINWRLRLDPDPRFGAALAGFCRLIGPAAAAQAAARGDTDDIDAARLAFDTLRESPPGQPGFLAARELFAMRILAASGNPLFSQLAPLLRGALAVSARQAVRRKQDWPDTVRLCERVIDAIRHADAGEAQAAALALIDHASPG
ncbi:DNA-binding FadR family transcriptional regulator [Paraburkholderia sp. GAS448]|uniref:FadR/GntR family transcriptional regulator n=1 Tax=Paraburkholderia sp. GAS448 TaxID=3035136 RepID=UPI003D240278